MNRMVYALFTPWLLPKIKHAFPMSFPSFVSSSIVGRPSHRMLKHQFLLSGWGEMANGNPLETWSWFVTRMPAYELWGSLFLFVKLCFLSSPFRCFPRASIDDWVRAWWLWVRWGPILRPDHPPTLKSELLPRAQEFQFGSWRLEVQFWMIMRLKKYY